MQLLQLLSVKAKIMTHTVIHTVIKRHQMVSSSLDINTS